MRRQKSVFQQKKKDETPEKKLFYRLLQTSVKLYLYLEKPVCFSNDLI